MQQQQKALEEEDEEEEAEDSERASAGAAAASPADGAGPAAAAGRDEEDEDAAEGELAGRVLLVDDDDRRPAGERRRLTVNYDDRLVTLFKEVRHLEWMGKPVPGAVRDIAKRALERYPLATAVQAVVQRASRLAEKGDLAASVRSPAGVVDPALFEKGSEAAMLTVLQRLEPIAAGQDPDRYGELARALAESAAALEAFFDGPDSVLVMADDGAVRRNRLNLLAVLRNQAAVLADFPRLAG